MSSISYYEGFEVVVYNNFVTIAVHALFASTV